MAEGMLAKANMKMIMDNIKIMLFSLVIRDWVIFFICSVLVLFLLISLLSFKSRISSEASLVVNTIFLRTLFPLSNSSGTVILKGFFIKNSIERSKSILKKHLHADSFNTFFLCSFISKGRKVQVFCWQKSRKNFLTFENRYLHTFWILLHTLTSFSPC